MSGFNLSNLLDTKKLIFWDFDGVIKDSNKIKNEAFLSIIKTSDIEVKKKITQHHYDNLGLSRFKKIPLYLSWAKEKDSTQAINKKYKQLSKTLIKSVVLSKWIKGSYFFIKKNYQKKIFVIISATPQQELEIILKKLSIYKNFNEIYGYPFKKKDVIIKVLSKYDIKKTDCIFIGDSNNDYTSAKKVKIPFLLKKNNENVDLHKIKGIKTFNDFND